MKNPGVEIEENPPTSGEENLGIEFASHPVTLCVKFGPWLHLNIRERLGSFLFSTHPPQG